MEIPRGPQSGSEKQADSVEKIVMQEQAKGLAIAVSLIKEQSLIKRFDLNFECLNSLAVVYG